jgi:hypothetical protein
MPGAFHDGSWRVGWSTLRAVSRKIGREERTDFINVKLLAWFMNFPFYGTKWEIALSI